MACFEQTRPYVSFFGKPDFKATPQKDNEHKEITKIKLL